MQIFVRKPRLEFDPRLRHKRELALPLFKSFTRWRTLPTQAPIAATISAAIASSVQPMASLELKNRYVNLHGTTDDNSSGANRYNGPETLLARWKD